MGAPMNNKLELKCVLHGPYQKFITDSDKQCPSCEQENAQRKQVQEVSKKKVTTTIQTAEVVISCEVHQKRTTLVVPKFLENAVHECPDCLKDQRKAEIKASSYQLIDREIAETGIPVNDIGMTFEQLDATRNPAQQAIVGRLIQYIKDITKAGISEGAKNILLCGNMGTGKTAYASVLLQGIIKRGIETVQDANDVKLKGRLSALFISEPALLNAITATWGSNATEKTQDLMNRLSGKSILCIDDVGSVATTHAHLLDAYAAILDERYKRRLPTIMTSNLKHTDLGLAIGARSADRFLEKHRIIIANFTWQGYRRGEMGTDEIEFF